MEEQLKDSSGEKLEVKQVHTTLLESITQPFESSPDVFSQFYYYIANPYAKQPTVLMTALFDKDAAERIVGDFSLSLKTYGVVANYYPAHSIIYQKMTAKYVIALSGKGITEEFCAVVDRQREESVEQLDTREIELECVTARETWQETCKSIAQAMCLVLPIPLSATSPSPSSPLSPLSPSSSFSFFKRKSTPVPVSESLRYFWDRKQTPPCLRSVKTFVTIIEALEVQRNIVSNFGSLAIRSKIAGTEGQFYLTFYGDYMTPSLGRYLRHLEQHQTIKLSLKKKDKPDRKKSSTVRALFSSSSSSSSSSFSSFSLSQQSQPTDSVHTYLKFESLNEQTDLLLIKSQLADYLNKINALLRSFEQVNRGDSQGSSPLGKVFFLLVRFEHLRKQDNGTGIESVEVRCLVRSYLHDVARALITAGADVNQQVNSKCPLELAILIGNIEFVDRLLEEGADITQKIWTAAISSRKSLVIVTRLLQQPDYLTFLPQTENEIRQYITQRIKEIVSFKRLSSDPEKILAARTSLFTCRQLLYILTKDESIPLNGLIDSDIDEFQEVSGGEELRKGMSESDGSLLSSGSVVKSDAKSPGKNPASPIRSSSTSSDFFSQSSSASSSSSSSAVSQASSSTSSQESSARGFTYTVTEK